MRRFFTLLFSCLCLDMAVAAESLLPNEEHIQFAPNRGEPVAAIAGEFKVPENRAQPDSRTLALRYVRFQATTDASGPPIVYLAGGPGGSGIETAKGPRFPLFMAMRAHGDVIALDQRGTGQSTTPPDCRSDQVIPQNKSVLAEDVEELYRAAVAECIEFWADSGVDILGYTTKESVEDLDALRRHLGVEKISLWGISYGTHLALATIKYRDAMLDKVILASAEGLDQTVKLPAQTDAYFRRLEQAIHTDPVAKKMFPDLLGMIRAVHRRLEQQPVDLVVPVRDGEPAKVVLNKRSMQQIASFMVADPQSALMLVQLYGTVFQEDYSVLTQLMSRFYDPDGTITLRGMSLAMDLASGIDAARLTKVRRQAESSLLGDVLNFPMPHLQGAIPGLDLGDAFRESPNSSVPTLLLSGTLDGRTYPEEQIAAVAGLRNVSHVTVVNAGHNLFMASPVVGEVMQEFMQDGKTSKQEIKLPPPKLAFP